MKDKAIDGLPVLLESLKEEISHWDLEPSTEPEETIRYGLYLIALDVLQCESGVVSEHHLSNAVYAVEPGDETGKVDGYARYRELSVEAKLPPGDYEAFRVQLKPFIQWLSALNLKRSAQLMGEGMSHTDALAQVIASDQPVFNAWIADLSS